MDNLRTKVILVGVGGPTCSGKTTLAKHLKNILPNVSVIIHQDDFAPPQELIPIHPLYDVQDWDDPEGAIDWPRLTNFLKSVKQDGKLPDHKSHDYLNEQKDIPIDATTSQELKAQFEKLAAEQERKGVRVKWGLVDGFLLYWDKGIIDELDIHLFLRVPHDVLKHRRHERHGYHTAVQSDPEGALWRDPPNYWEQIVYPAYVKAHKDMFEDGDVENGKQTGEKVPGVVIMEPVKKGEEMSMDDMVRRSCEVLAKFVQGSEF